MLSLRLFQHYLLSRRSGALIRSVSWMAMIGIVVGVAALVIVIGVMNGFNRDIRERHLKAEPHLVVHAPPVEDSTTWYQNSEKKIKEVLGSELENITSFSTQDVVLKTVDGYFAGAVAKGLESEAVAEMLKRLNKTVEAGEGGVRELGHDEVLLGNELAEALELVPGDKVVLIAPEALLLPPEEAPPIQTVVVRDFFYSQVQDVDGKMMIFNRKNSLPGLTQTASTSRGFELRLTDGDHYEMAQEKLKQAGFDVQSWPERNSAMFFALKMEKMAMTVFLALSALITSFSIITVLILLVTQKRKEIGMLMAMGLTQKETQKTFTLVGVWLAMAGVLIGLVLGITVCFVVARYPMNILPSIYYDRTIPAEVRPGMILTIFFAALGISFLGSYIPARQSASMGPSESMRGN